jgi:hypothetical protein
MAATFSAVMNEEPPAMYAIPEAIASKSITRLSGGFLLVDGVIDAVLAHLC